MAIEVAKIILFDKNDQLLIYLRDDKPTIPYPNNWDLLGGLVNNGETPEIAIIREVDEEIGVKLNQPQPFRRYTSREGFEFYTFWGKISQIADELTLTEGRYLTSIDLKACDDLQFVPVLKQAIAEFIEAHLSDLGMVLK